MEALGAMGVVASVATTYLNILSNVIDSMSAERDQLRVRVADLEVQLESEHRPHHGGRGGRARTGPCALPLLPFPPFSLL